VRRPSPRPLAALDKLRANWGKNYPGLIASWERVWEEFIPFLAFDREIRRVIYTTNAIETTPLVVSHVPVLAARAAISSAQPQERATPAPP
jgi:transposase-like protein